MTDLDYTPIACQGTWRALRPRADLLSQHRGHPFPPKGGQRRVQIPSPAWLQLESLPYSGKILHECVGYRKTILLDPECTCWQGRDDER